MSSGNGSYQKYDGGSGTYQEIRNGVQPNNRKKWLIGVTVALILGGIYMLTTRKRGHSSTDIINKSLSSGSSAVSVSKEGKLKLFDDQNRYVMEDYDAKSAFSSFLPGVAGYFGKPAWAFYVNRGQAIATFGTESKDYPMLEFNPANKAYQMTQFWGFRTFVVGSRQTVGGSKSFLVEPFSTANVRDLDKPADNLLKPKRILFVGTNEVEIEEIDALNDLKTNVNYFILPEEDFASLVRRTTFTNVGSAVLKIDVLDGLAKMEPFGGPLDGMLKSMGRTLEGWMGVYHADDTLSMPFYKLSTEPSDQASVKIEEAGHYCLSFIERSGLKSDLLPIVFDSSKVFGKDTSLGLPLGISTSNIGAILENPQYGWAKTSSAFAAAVNITLKPGENITIASIYGKADTVNDVPVVAERVTSADFVATKFDRARTLINELTAGVETSTVNPLFDGTVKQMFLDNSLRGGVPTILGNVDDDTTYDEDPAVKVYHSFSRIHGDLERDYNAFYIDPTFFSQGPGNYRDVAQNRRNDVTFFPRMGSFDIQMFLSYIQADGYEPLTVEAVVFRFSNPQEARDLAVELTADATSAETLGNVLVGGPFRPGQLFQLCEQLNVQINPKYSKLDFINMIVAKTEDRAMAVYGQGYWGDHWDYYMDMIEAYIAVFPDKEEELMYDKPLRYFFSTATVKPRSQKYVLTLTFDASAHHVLQLDATYYDKGKADEQQAFFDANTGLLGIEANWQRTADGEPFMSSAIAKLFHLAAIKFAMRDAWGMGIEYEGGRPGWLDSMNGLPGMVGSGMPETYELLLLLKYVKKVVDTYKRDVIVPDELITMIDIVNDALVRLKKYHYVEEDKPSPAVPPGLFRYWDRVATARENYRQTVEYYFSGNVTALAATEVSSMVDKWIAEVELGITRSFKFATEGYGDDGTSGIPACFFAYEITSWVENGGRNDVGLPLVNATAMSVKKFPLFLEGPVRYMKTIEDDNDKMSDMYSRVLSSGLRDKILNMYFLSASLKGQSYDMGRQIAFAPGWLENQSIWLHMSYKYYLELLRGKLFDQFFSEMKGGGILPFMDPIVYGRSLMECSSFIASSAFPDPSIVGEGFLARLSGSTAEFMDMWKLMFIGPKLFFLNNDGAVEMQLQPAIPSWLFVNEDESSDTAGTVKTDEDGNFLVTFKLFAAVPVTYHNPGGVNRYGENPSKYVVTNRDGSVLTFESPTIPTETAIEIRKMKVKSIDAYFA